MYVPSSELGLSQPLIRRLVCPSPQNRGGTHSPAGEGLGESQFRRLEKKLSTLLLCVVGAKRREEGCFFVWQETLRRFLNDHGPWGVEGGGVYLKGMMMSGYHHRGIIL